jgi:signal transduction histidine kinase
MVGTLLIALLAVSLVVVLIITHKRQLKSRLEKQKMQLKFEEELLHTRIEVQEQALLNFSREIHDSIGQDLSLLRIQLDMLQPYLKDQQGQALLQDYQVALKNTIKNLRLISHSLNTNLILQKGLEEALGTEVARIRNFTPLVCSLAIEGEHMDLSREKELLVFRIFQESLQNITKHAEATEIAVSLQYQPEALLVSIRDNGKGFSTVDAHSSNHQLGLANMRHRTSLLQGTIHFQSALNGGTNVQLTVPYN